MGFPKSKDYVNAIYNISNIINTSARQKQNERFSTIAYLISNYFYKIINETNFDKNELVKTKHINLVPFFEYVSKNKIELYDFNDIDVNNFNVGDELVIERFILSHIYYITQQ
jgi:hypothetical protein